jgi:hypothetical protein
MSAELIPAATVLVGGGAGAWLADKLLGQSFAALGEQFQAFAGKRLKAIFAKAEELNSGNSLNPLPPGFALEYLQKASFSEDDEELTILWAGLLLQASENFNNRHPSFVNILSQLTVDDALVLEKIVDEDFPPIKMVSFPVTLNSDTRRLVANGMKNVSDTDSEAEAEITRLLQLDLKWPGHVTAARVYYQDGDKQHPITGGDLMRKSSFENLLRLGLLEKFEVSNSITPYSVAVEGYLATVLGISFVQTCRGVK